MQSTGLIRGRKEGTRHGSFVRVTCDYTNCVKRTREHTCFINLYRECHMYGQGARGRRG